MGFFDTLTNAFTGAPAQQAADQTRNYLTSVNNTGRNDLQAAYERGTAATNAGSNQAIDYLGQGRTGALDQLTGARGAYSPLSALGAKYGAATGTALDALGVNGPEGNARATTAFQASPGYQWNVDQALNNTERAYNAAGQGASGNALKELTDRASNLANQEYGNWRNTLAGFVSPELSATGGAASGVAGTYGQGAGIENQYGTNTAGVAQNRAAMLSDLASKQASGDIGLASSIASPYASTYGQEAAAKQQGSANLWNLAQNVAALGTGQFGRAAGSGGSSPSIQPYFKPGTNFGAA